MAEPEEIDALGISFRRSKPPLKERATSSIPPSPTSPIVLGIDEEYYKITHKHRGIALVFNHYRFDHPHLSSRKGTDVDCRAVEKTFKDLGFQMLVHQDLKCGRIIDELERVSKLDHSHNDCLVVVVMTHGDPDILHARDEPYYISALWEYFTGDNCPSLAGKPKLFFIQACRGDETDDGVDCMVEFDTMPRNSTAAIKIPKMADFLVMYATPPGNYSFRSPVNGSWFIQTLCKELSSKAQDHDLNRILMSVNRHMAYKYASNVPGNRELHNKKQVGQIVTSLTRLLHFYGNPTREILPD